MDEIVWPTVKGMAARGTPFKGALYVGLMITDSGPKVIEYNVRFGDPECQVLMLRLKSDLLPALLAVADGVLKTFDLRWHDDAALAVVMAAKGYPGDYVKGSEIRGLDAARMVEGVEVFHAGTIQDGAEALEQERTSLTEDVRRLEEEVRRLERDAHGLRAERDELHEALQGLASQMTCTADEILYRFGARSGPGDLASR